MHDVLLILNLPARNARGKVAEELLGVLRVETRLDEAVQVYLAPDEELQVLDAVRVTGVVVRDAPGDLDAERVNAFNASMTKRRS